jgi:hypothetical protein
VSQRQPGVAAYALPRLRTEAADMMWIGIAVMTVVGLAYVKTRRARKAASR